MAKIRLKKSSVASNAPGTGDLDYGELAINYADGRLYYKNSSNVIKNFVDSDLLQAAISGLGGGGGTGTLDSAAALALFSGGTGVTYDGSGQFSIGQNVATTASPTFNYIRLTSTADASVSSTAHAFQTGPTSGANIIMDNNEIMARNNGAVSGLHFNPDGGDITFHNNTTAGTVNIGGNKVWHAGNDGSASGLDADLLDGRHWTRFIEMNTDHTSDWTPTGVGTHAGGWHGATTGDGYISLGSTNANLNVIIDGNYYAGGSSSNKVWHAGNDGSGSGLDADLLDGQQNTKFVREAGTAPTNLDSAGMGVWRINTGHTNQPAGTNYGTLVSFDNSSDTGFQFAATYGSGRSLYWRGGNAPIFGGTGSFQTWEKIWTNNNDGAASGLDADLLDGQHGSYYYAASNPSGYTTYTANQAVDTTSSPTFAGATVNGNVTIASTDSGSSAAPELILYRNSASPADGDYLGQIQFKGRNDGNADEIYAKVTGKVSDVTNGTEDGLIETAIKGNGSFTIVSRQKSDELQLINGTGLSVAGNTTLSGTLNTHTIPGGTGTLALTSDLYTTARADSDAKNALTGGTGVTYTAATGTIAIGQSVATSDSPTFAGLTTTGDVSFSSGNFYVSGTGNVGFGDKAWDTVGLTSPAKWEFYRNTSTATLMIHQDDGSSNAELHLRSGTRDWVIANDTTDLSIICEGAEVLNVDAAGNITANGLTVDSDTLYVDATNNRVGIGELTPDAQLHVTASSGDTVLILEADPTNTNENDTPYIIFRADGSTGTTALVGLVGNSGDHATGTSANSLLLEATGSRAVQIAPASSVSAHFDATGDIGIGTTSPSAKLDVVGNTEINGNLNVVGGELQISGAAGTAGQVLTSNGSGSAPSWQDASGGGGITYVRKTTTYTAAVNDGVIADTSGGAWTLTLPATPSTGDTVAVADGANWSVNNLTVARNGSTIEGDAADLTMDIGGAHVTFIYDGTTWQMYAQIGAVGGSGIVSIGNDWSMKDSAGSLLFAYNGVNKMKLDTSGNLTVVGDITTAGTL